MTPDILTACAIGAVIGAASAVAFFAIVERAFRPRKVRP
jgi:NhaP-type Na+/H+ or K+/H+ antiporter